MASKRALLERGFFATYIPRYQEILMIDKRLSYVVVTNQISKRAAKCVARRLWVPVKGHFRRPGCLEGAWWVPII
jgi:hypothetical protein